MESDTQPRLSKKLQVITLCPLVTGMVVCTIIIIGILFGTYLSWIDSTTNYIKDIEKENILQLSKTASDLLRSRLEKMLSNLNIIKGLYESEDIELAVLADSLITTTNVYLVDDERDETYSEWLSPNNNDGALSSVITEDQYNNTAISDIYMRIFFNDDSTDYNQIGFVLEENGLDYRYPKNDMSYVRSNFDYTYSGGQCSSQSGSDYDSRCSEAYRMLKDDEYTVLVYNENDQLKVLLDSDVGAYIYYIPSDFFDADFSEVEDYIFFFTDNTGNRTIRVFPSISSDHTSVWDILFTGDDELQDSGSVSIYESFVEASTSNDSSSSFTLEGYNSEYYGSVNTLDINITSSKEEYQITEVGSMAVGTIINTGITFYNWNEVLDDVINTIIIQMVVFLILLCITIAVVWFLGMSITDRITYPIYLFEQYLREKISLQALDKNYNKEVNSILMYLRMLETLEKMIEPNFLQNPKQFIRENNLKEAQKLFDSVNNRRGKSIIMNLLGNIRFADDDYQGAVNYYKDALEEIEKLIEEVKQQEIDENELTEKEKLILIRKAGKESLSWESEKNFLYECLIDRKQQLCLGLRKELHESPLELSEIRSKLKEIYNYMHEILQYYASSRTYFVRLLKTMINIAEIFQELKYYHSGIELLDIVHDELKKLDLESGPEIDIDVTRLSRIGVNIKQEDGMTKSLHFIIKGITFEKDILYQMMYYRRGLLLLESDKHYEAGIAFTLAIVIFTQEKGKFYDPKIRELSVKALHGLMEKFGLLRETPDLKEMYDSLHSTRYSLSIVFCYDFYAYTKITDDIINFIEKNIDEKWKLGGMTLNPNSALKMKIEQRDMPARDYENMLLAAKNEILKESVYDTIIKASSDFSEDMTRKSMLVVISELNTQGSCRVSDLQLVTDKARLVVIARDGVLTEEFYEFLEKTNSVLLEFSSTSSFSKALQSSFSYLTE